MVDVVDTHWVADLTWEEAEDAFRTTDLVTLPCGSTEQHSTHLPLSVDTIRAENLTAELLKRAPEHGLEVRSLPPLPYGYSEHHIEYPGTVTVSFETYIDLIVEIGRCLSHHDVSNFLVLNCHGGNKEPHKLAIDRIQREYDLNVFYVHWTDFARERLEERFGTEWGHAGEYETSQIEHYYPEKVRKAKKVPQTRRGRFEAHPFSYFHELTVEGGLGDPTESDPEFMARLIDETTDEILEAIRSDLQAVDESKSTASTT